MDLFWSLFYFFIFPGFLFTACIGLLTTWIDRKVTARVQYRKGPPLFQPFYDVIKLFGKETVLPGQGQSVLFLTAPLIGLVGVTAVSTMLWTAVIYNASFVGDIIVVLYLLVFPSLAVIIGGAASGNPLASMGTSREIKLLLSYEFPFLICITALLVKTGGNFQLTDFLGTSTAASVSGIICFLVVLLCVQAKLGFVPFDIAEAETEIMSGPYIEYSGIPLSLYKITQAMMLFTLPVFMTVLFFGGMMFSGWEIAWSIGKYILIIVLIVVIKNTNPRVRIDQAVNFFWKYCGAASCIALALAIVGRVYSISWL